METSFQFLPPEIEAAVAAQHGGPVSVPGQHGKYVVMNVDVYGGMLAATPEELSDSVAAKDLVVVLFTADVDLARRQISELNLFPANTIHMQDAIAAY